MKKRKLLISSLGMILLSGSLIAGATYSLFTSTSTHDISVSSAKVDLTATILDNSLKYYSLGSNEPSTTGFANGGTASILNGNLSLERVTPGDKLTFSIKLQNDSTAKIRYRVSVNCSSGADLFSVLNITGHGDGQWNELNAKVSPETLNISVELPKEVGNYYQDKTTTISFRVEAIQANGDVSTITENPETLKVRDEVYASKMNAILREGEAPVTTSDAVNKLSVAGINFETLIPEYEGHVFAYNSDTNTTLPLVKSELLTREADPNMWLVVKNETDLNKYTDKYSVYLASNFDEDVTPDNSVTVKNGFDIGTNESIDVNYVDTATETIKLVTNNSKISVDNPNGTVNHYADALDVDVKNVAGNSYHEFGTVKGNLVLNSTTGRVVIEDKGDINTLNVVNDTAKVVVNNKQSKVKVVAESNVNVESLNLPKFVQTIKKDLTSKVYLNKSKNGVHYFDNISTAVAQASDYATISLLDDANLGNTYAQCTYNLTIDLNNHTFTNESKDGFGFLCIYHNDLIIKNGKVITNTLLASLYENHTPNVVIENTKILAPANETQEIEKIFQVLGGTLTIDKNSEAIAEGDRFPIFINDDSHVIVKGKIVSDTYYCISANGSAEYVAACKAKIDVYEGAEITSKSYTAIYMPNTVRLNVYGGLIQGDTAIYQKCGISNIMGGKIVGTGTAKEFIHKGSGNLATGDAIVVESCDYPGDYPTINVTATEECIETKDNNAKKIRLIKYVKDLNKPLIDPILNSTTISAQVEIVYAPGVTPPAAPQA